MMRGRGRVNSLVPRWVPIDTARRSAASVIATTTASRSTSCCAEFILSTLYESPSLSTAAQNRYQARGEAFAKAQGIAKAYSGLGKLLAYLNVDAVVVASPDTTHEAQVIASASAGKHILCGKPMSSLESCKKIAKAVRASGDVSA
jgi:1,5-anhydro-D-fructose reductase (1,5-anhydro-D-mannitol-forming)